MLLGFRKSFTWVEIFDWEVGSISLIVESVPFMVGSVPWILGSVPRCKNYIYTGFQKLSTMGMSVMDNIL